MNFTTESFSADDLVLALYIPGMPHPVYTRAKLVGDAPEHIEMNIHAALEQTLRYMRSKGHLPQRPLPEYVGPG